MFALANASYERSKCFIQFFLNIRINSLKGTVNAVPFRCFIHLLHLFKSKAFTLGAVEKHTAA